jgi:RimJ/RimL family protein N-acetyltransferase
MEESWIRKVISQEMYGSRINRAIIVDGKYVGNVYLTDLNVMDLSCQFHIFIGDKELQGKGIGTKATMEMVCLLFACLCLLLKKFSRWEQLLTKDFSAFGWK